MASLEEMSVESADLALDIRVSDGDALLALAGEFDLSRAGELREFLVQPELQGARAVRVDLSRVSFLDSVIIGLLVAACKRVRSAGGSFAVICDREAVARTVFEIDGLVDYLQMQEPAPEMTAACVDIVENALQAGLGSPDAGMSCGTEGERVALRAEKSADGNARSVPR